MQIPRKLTPRWLAQASVISTAAAVPLHAEGLLFGGGPVIDGFRRSGKIHDEAEKKTLGKWGKSTVKPWEIRESMGFWCRFVSVFFPLHQHIWDNLYNFGASSELLWMAKFENQLYALHLVCSSFSLAMKHGTRKSDPWLPQTVAFPQFSFPLPVKKLPSVK